MATVRTPAPARTSWPRTLWRIRGFAVIALSTAAAAHPQEAPAIRTTVNLVNVSFTARDAKGALIENLAKDDLEILEDGVPQKIVHFSKSTEVPLTLGLIVDASDSQSHFYKKHEKDLEVFLTNVLGPKDRAFLLCFGNHLRLVKDWDHRGLKEQPAPGEVAAQMLGHLKQYEKNSDAFPEIGPPEMRELGTAFYDSIYLSVSEKMAREEGRRALLIFSDGEDNSSSHDMMTTIEAAQSANVLVYTIRYTEPMKHGELSARNKYGIRVMDRIAKETGASNIDARVMEPKEYFQEIAAELRTSYEIGYYPSDSMKDESFRKIAIRPKNDTVRIRAKTGYFAR
jgi:Ca-activated chloride channel family protein